MRRVVRAVVVAILFNLIYDWSGKPHAPFLIIVPFFAVIYLITHVLLDLLILKVRKKNT